MSKLLTVSTLLFSLAMAQAALAETPRYSALKYSCDKIQSLIEKHGAAIFRYPSPRKPGLTLYDRYVQSDSYCMSYQMTERVMIPSSDSDRCPVRHCITADCDGFGAGCLLR